VDRNSSRDRAIAFGPPVFADELSGQASFIAGETIEIYGNGVRLAVVEKLGRCKNSVPYRRAAEGASDIDALIAS
jgi:hypothetical protein